MTRNPLHWKLHWQILAAILLAIGAGWLTAYAVGQDHGFGSGSLAVYDFFGRIFINALKMLIVPLIVSSIIVGIAGIAHSGRLGAMGGKTIGFYLLTTLLAVLLGLFLINLTAPGLSDGVPVGPDLGLRFRLGCRLVAGATEKSSDHGIAAAVSLPSALPVTRAATIAPGT